MKCFHAAALVLVAAAPGAYAEPPKAPEKVTVAVGATTQVVVKYTAPDGKVMIVVPGFASADCTFFRGYEATKGEANFLVIPNKPGPFRVSFLIQDEVTPSTLVIETTGTPPVPPDPGPKPPTPPGPVPPTQLFVVVVEEDEDQVMRRGVFLSDKALAGRMKEKGHRFRIVDKDVKGPDGRPPADIVRFLDASRGKAYPQLFLVNPKGQTVYSGDVPKTPAELLTLLQKHGG